jgi:cystine transport system substrate-binding protein
MRHTVTIAVLALVGGLLFGSGAKESAGTSDLLGEVESRGYLTVGTMGTYPPYNFINQSEEMDGFDADIAREIASRLGVEARFVPTEWSGMIEGLLSGKFDVVVSQMTITEERQKQMRFTQPYIRNEVKIIVQDGNDTIGALEDFRGKRIGIGLGTNDEAYLRNVARPKVGDFEIVTYNDVITSLMDLDNGRIDATINNIYAISPLVEARGFKIKTVGDPIKADEAGIAFRMENTESLLAAVDAALSEMKADGTYDGIIDKWFGKY